MTNQEAQQAVSPAVAEAQARLLAMREKLQHSAADRTDDRAVLADGRCQHQANSHPDHLAAHHRSTIQAISSLPEHLGWGSRQLSQAVRRSLRNRKLTNCHSTQQIRHGAEWLKNPDTPTPAIVTTERPSAIEVRDVIPDAGTQSTVDWTDIELGEIKLHPDIGLGILRRKAAAAGRIWLLLRWMDGNGRGWSEIAQVRRHLCDEQSAIKVCGWRQLRSLLRQGEGIFWKQHEGRLWLRSVPKVALALGIERLSGRPVSLPVKILLQGIGQVRAHFFASFHSGRKKTNPISRRSLREISQVSPRTQHDYEKRTGVRKQKNYAIGPGLTNGATKERAWQQGSACFNWHDRKGTLGVEGKAHLAWQLPNSYIGPHKQRARGRQKRFNRELAVLFTKGITGNDQVIVESKPKRYFDGAKNAIRCQTLSHAGVYWRGSKPGLWYFIEPS